MKELYISPVLNVLCFAPVERLALSFDDLLEAAGGPGLNRDPSNPASDGVDDLPVGL